MKKILLAIALIMIIFQMVTLAIAIDIGSPAINRITSTATAAYTYVNKNNPANDTGTITIVEIWAKTTIINAEVATFFVVSGNNLSTRDYEFIGTVTAGAKRTFNVNLDVVTGDYIGIYKSVDGAIEKDYNGGDGYWFKVGDNIPCTNAAFTSTTDHIISLGGTGATVGWGHKWNTITIGKWNTTTFSKWNGLQ